MCQRNGEELAFTELAFRSIFKIPPTIVPPCFVENTEEIHRICPFCLGIGDSGVAPPLPFIGITFSGGNMESTVRSNNVLIFEATNIPRQVVANRRHHTQESFIHNNLQIVQSLWDNSPNGKRLTDENGIIVEVNGAFCRIVGMQAEELVGKPFTVAYNHGKNSDALIRAYHLRFHGAKLEGTIEREMKLWGGEMRYFEVQSSLIRSDERPLLLSIFRDITLRKAAEEALKSSERRFRKVFESVQEVIFTINRAGVFTSLNPEFERKTGWKAEEWIGKKFHPLLHPDDARAAWKSVSEMMRTKAPTTVALRTQSRDGRYLIGEYTWSPELVDGELVSVIGTVRDITERKQVDNALKESEEKYRNLFANSVQPMFQSSVDGKLLNANRALLNLLGYDDFLELADMNMKDLYVNPDMRDQITEVLETKNQMSNVEFELKRKDGKVITVVEYSRALKDEKGSLIGFEGILEDITVRKAMEQKMNQYLQALENSKKVLSELNAEKDKLFSVLSHDMRSPFASILGFCEILTNESDQLTDEEKREFISYIKEAAQNQLELANQMLDWSRLESGRVKQEMKELDLANVAKKSVNGLLGLSKKKNIQVASNLPEGLHAFGDGQLLMQLFENLISNALKFTPENGRISVDLASQDSRNIVITVKDNGVGIPEADLHRLFKVEEKYTRKGLGGEKGTGLGLPICAEIMQKHQGSIRVESQAGKGTTFILTFQNNSLKDGMNILIADDEDGVRVLHSRYVKRFFPEAHIILASNGNEAVELARKHQPQVIVADYAMPAMNGFEMLKQLKQAAETKNIPVVMITGEDSKASSEAMTLTGASAIFSKPVVPEKLEAELRKILASFLQS